MSAAPARVVRAPWLRVADGDRGLGVVTFETEDPARQAAEARPDPTEQDFVMRSVLARDDGLLLISADAPTPGHGRPHRSPSKLEGVPQLGGVRGWKCGCGRPMR